KKVAVVRHPMPYGDLVAQKAQRFEDYADLERYHCTIEEREEYEPHLARGSIVYAGVDYGEILSRAQEEADVILWDGGNNDLPFPHVGALLPAMGYSEQQRRDLAETINASDADAVLIATPIDLRKVCELTKPAYRAIYELEVVSSPGLDELLKGRLGGS